MKKARAKYPRTPREPAWSWSWRHGQAGPEGSVSWIIFTLRAGGLDRSTAHGFRQGRVSYSSTRETAKGFLIDVGRSRRISCVGSDACAGLNTSLPVRQLHLLFLKRKQSRYSSLYEMMCTSAHSCWPPFGGLFAWARALLAKNRAPCWVLSASGIRTWNTSC